MLAALAVMLALEGGLRLARERFDGYLAQHEMDRSYSLRPNAEGWQASEGDVYVKINSDGLRDHERPVQRPVDTLRVAVVGPSDAEAIYVPLEQTFEAAMERNLAPLFQPRGNRVDVLNFGVLGYAQSQQYLTLHNHVWKYDPQLVVQVWNQIGLLRNTPETDPWGAEMTPFYNLRNGRLEPAESTRALKSLSLFNPREIAIRNRLFDWMNRSYLLCMLKQATVNLQRQIGELRAAVRLDFGGPTLAARLPEGFAQRWVYLPYQPEMQEDWEIGEAFVREMKADCDRHGAEYWVVIVDQPMQSNPDAAARDAFARKMGLPSLSESDLRLQRFCEANGIHVLRLAPRMGEYAAAHGLYLHTKISDTEGHWNQLGNRVAGQSIAEALRTQSPTVQAWEAGRRSNPTPR